MSLQEQQNFLARLYTDAEIRRDFLAEPLKIGFENNLNENEIAEIELILPEEITFFAESLFWKRLREVEKMLPLTKEFSSKNFASLFREFSQDFNPQTIKKHLEDAIGFGNFLQTKEISELSKSIAKFEKTKLEFFGFGKQIAFCKLNFDLRNIQRRTINPQIRTFKKRTTIAVWLKIGNKIKHFIF